MQVEVTWFVFNSWAKVDKSQVVTTDINDHQGY